MNIYIVQYINLHLCMVEYKRADGHPLHGSTYLPSQTNICSSISFFIVSLYIYICIHVVYSYIRLCCTKRPPSLLVQSNYTPRPNPSSSPRISLCRNFPALHLSRCQDDGSHLGGLKPLMA